MTEKRRTVIPVEVWLYCEYCNVEMKLKTVHKGQQRISYECPQCHMVQSDEKPYPRIEYEPLSTPHPVIEEIVAILASGGFKDTGALQAVPALPDASIEEADTLTFDHKRDAHESGPCTSASSTPRRKCRYCTGEVMQTGNVMDPPCTCGSKIVLSDLAAQDCDHDVEDMGNGYGKCTKCGDDTFPMEDPAIDGWLHFKIMPSDDEELTCFLCTKQGVDAEFTFRRDDVNGSRATVTQGVHKACFDKYGIKYAEYHRTDELKTTLTRIREMEQVIADSWALLPTCHGHVILPDALKIFAQEHEAMRSYMAEVNEALPPGAALTHPECIRLLVTQRDGLRGKFENMTRIADEARAEVEEVRGHLTGCRKEKGDLRDERDELEKLLAHSVTTLDDAITHAKSITTKYAGSPAEKFYTQLKEWLIELKEYRA